MKIILEKLYNHQNLSESEAYDILFRITRGEYNSSQIASFLTVFLMRPVCVEELTGFRNSLLDQCIKIDFGDLDSIDVCGTGGDSKNTFNISTITAFVLAGSGIKVTKHGNYGVSSLSGSSNVMEYFGYEFTTVESKLQKQLDTANICFLHAPLFHPAMKSVAQIRKELGVKTFFNMLGPLVNPANPKYQLTGVFNLELARLYQYLLQQTEKNFRIIHSLDGYDEVSLTGQFKMLSPDNEQLLDAAHFGTSNTTASELFGGNSLEESAHIFIQILQANGTKAQREVVYANSALAIQCIIPNLSINEAKRMAEDSIHSGKALKSFKKLITA